MDEKRMIILDMIKTYEKNPVLWNSHHPDYYDVEARNEAYEQMVEIYRQLLPEADINAVKDKIRVWRYRMRLECRKINAIRKYAKCEEDALAMYVPNLWYYDELKFLNLLNIVDQRDQKRNEHKKEKTQNAKKRVQVLHVPKRSAPIVEVSNEPKRLRVIRVERRSPSTQQNYNSNLDGCDESSISENANETSHAQSEYEQASTPIKENKTPNAERSYEQRVPVSQCQHPDEDEYDFFGKMIAKKLKKLEEPIRSIAQKHISDVLFQASMGRLDENSGFMNDSIISRNTSQTSNFERKSSQDQKEFRKRHPADIKDDLSAVINEIDLDL